MVPRHSLPAIALAVCLAASTAAAPDPRAPRQDGVTAPLLLGKQYPIETYVDFPAALLHWLDSLVQLTGAGWTAGKTVAAHRQDYFDLLGRPTEEDLGFLGRYKDVRIAFANHQPEDRDALTRVFFEAATLDDALAGARAVLADRDRDAFEASVLHFAENYRKIWRGGGVPRGFVERSLNDRRRKALARFLIDVAGLFEVAADATPRPRLLLTPVRAGFGTHAQAVDHFLLVEIRPGEGLLDQVAPIVHENAHLLYFRMGSERLEALRSVALARGQVGEDAWRRLKEALPTAIAQGVAEWRFSPDSWRLDANWYHVEAIDSYAKAIFPTVKRALESGRSFDAAMVEELVGIYAGDPAAPATTPSATPRSP